MARRRQISLRGPCFCFNVLLDKVTVVGFGLMGAQISQVLSLSGVQVAGYDVSEDVLSRGWDLIKTGKYGLDPSVRRGRISRDEADSAIARISTTTSLENALDHAQFVLEAAVENLKVKQEIFRKAAVFADQDAVIVSNTSTLSIADIGKVLQPADKERVAGMHFFNPPQIMKLIEIVRTRQTNQETISRIQAIAVTLRKTPVLVLDYPGFVANRIGISVFSEASELLERGIANIRDIDLCMRLGYGYSMGPFELGDLVGLDARLRNMKAMYSKTRDEKFRPPRILRRLVAEGFLGDPATKPGSRGGYYEYFNLKRPSEDSR